jgi:hypothetical protein
MTLHQDELLRNVVERGVFVKGCGVLGVKRFTHEQTIEPHLRWVDLLVPEAAFGSARMSFQLFAQERSSLAIFLVAGAFIKEQEHSAGKNVVEVVVVG